MGLLSTPEIDKSLVGSVLGAVNMDQLIAGPLNAMVLAQTDAANSYVDFLTKVCIKDGKAVAVDFVYEENLVDGKGLPIYKQNNKGYVAEDGETVFLEFRTDSDFKDSEDKLKIAAEAANKDGATDAEKEEHEVAKKAHEADLVNKFKNPAGDTVDISKVDEEIASKGVIRTIHRSIKVPLMAMITHPTIAIEEGTIDFEMSITQMAEDKSKQALDAEVEAGIKAGPFSLSVKAKISSSSEQTRKTDTSAKYKFNVKVARTEPPEAMSKVLDMMMNGVNPIRVGQPKQ